MRSLYSMTGGKKSEKKWRIDESPEKYYYDDLNRVPTAPSTEGSEIVDYFAGKIVFLTGATGFVGKIVIEKLLRCCPDIKSIFILCREKKGKNINERTNEIFNDVLFTKLNQLHPKCHQKVVPINGDVGEEGLGMSEMDRKLLRTKVNVIFHIAATVRFNEKIRTAMSINVQGTLEMMHLGKECTNLDSFVHVSTAYSHSNRQFIDEKYYDMPVNYKDLAALIRNSSDEELERLCLHKPWPNTYTFTKAIAEEVIKIKAGDLPIVIIRPSIIVSTYKEPIRGWIGNVYGPTGVLIGAGLGILHTLYFDGKNVAEIVPVDWVVNATIAAAYKNAKSRRAVRPIPLKKVTCSPLIYNYVSSVENPLSWDEYFNMNRHYGMKVPTIQAYWYYSFWLTKYKQLNFFFTIFLQWLPAVCLDGLTVMVGKKPQLMNIYWKMNKFANVISYFSIRRLCFKNNNVQNIWAELSDVDQKVFPFDIKLVDWEKHCHMNIFGVRTYIMKDDPSTLQAARKKWQKLLYLAHHVVKFTLYLVGLLVIYILFSTIF